MNTELGSEPSGLSDRELLEQVKLLAGSECNVIARLMAHLSEMETRRLYLSQGCRSLYTYCTEILHLTEYEACLRAQVARECRKYPLILEMLTRGALHLTSVRLLIPLLTPENHRELLESAVNKTKREVEQIVARWRPRPDVRTSVRKMPNSQAGTRPGALPPADDLFQQRTGAGGRESGGESTSEGGNGSVTGSTNAAESAGGDESANGAGTAAPRATVTPLAPERFRITFTASEAMVEKLRRLQDKDLLSHQIPDRDEAKIFDRALDVLLREVEKQKLAATDKPRVAGPTAPGSRHIPAEVKRRVWERDGGRCAFIGENGHRCTERCFLQFHHVDPHGDGGAATVKNIEMRCSDHNRYESELFYGPWRADPRDLEEFYSRSGEEFCSGAGEADQGWRETG